MNGLVAHATVGRLSENEYGNIVVELTLDDAVDDRAAEWLEAVEGLECTVLEASPGRAVVVVPEYLAPMTTDWSEGLRVRLTTRL